MADTPVVLHIYRSPFESMLTWHGIGAHDLRTYRAGAHRDAERRMPPLLEKAGLKPSQLVLRRTGFVPEVPRAVLIDRQRRIAAKDLRGDELGQAVRKQLHAPK